MIFLILFYNKQRVCQGNNCFCTKSSSLCDLKDVSLTQKFKFTLDGNSVSAKPGKLGTNLKVDLGIVKCHFELGAGKDNFNWS